ncbi:MAG TPA: 3-hydroxybutyrate oligomer hydrolase family protein, partial [Burkholderiales bacterium]|nr:3-hydroxybutyrate oligomer hydrolase family protein [Burkholderiales bacterium]
MRFGFSLVVLFAAGCAGTPDFSGQKILHTRYDGNTDDLLTAGLGRTGLGLATPPAVREAKSPSVAELRRRAIHANYRALADMSPAGGYGVLYGPNIDLAGKDTLGEGKVAGDEYLTLFDGSTLMVQVPERFDPKNPCIVTASSSGSRGIYGAIGTVGEWGLKRGCAVAYTDKGTGTGFHDLATDSVNVVSGEWMIREKAGSDALFAAALSDAERTRYLREYPNRIAVKQAHSQRNPEKDWGRYTLAAVDFSFYIINSLKDARAGTYTPENTIVIASSVSNGGYAALAAAEQDKRGLIDGVAVSEPNVSLAGVRPLLDYMTLLNLYEPCAALAVANAPLNTVSQPLKEARCASLAKKGLLKAPDLAGQAGESQKILLDYGFLPEAALTLPSHYTLYVPQSISLTYANSYGRFAVTDNLCGYSFAATAPSGDNAAQPIPAAGLELSFASSNGIPPTGGVNLVNNLSTGGAREDRLSISPSSGARDMNLDGALCLRSLATGLDAAGQPLTATLLEQHRRVQAGIVETQLTGNLQGKPAVFVNGRADAILPPNFASRAYFARNKTVEPGSKLYYYEVTNAHHLDVLNGVAGFDSRYLPL